MQKALLAIAAVALLVEAFLFGVRYGKSSVLLVKEEPQPVAAVQDNNNEVRVETEAPSEPVIIKPVVKAAIPSVERVVQKAKLTLPAERGVMGAPSATPDYPVEEVVDDVVISEEQSDYYQSEEPEEINDAPVIMPPRLPD